MNLLQLCQIPVSPIPRRLVLNLLNFFSVIIPVVGVNFLQEALLICHRINVSYTHKKWYYTLQGIFNILSSTPLLMCKSPI